MSRPNEVWRKSQHSGGQNGDCVELSNQGGLRDSKNPQDVLRVDVTGLLAAARAGQFDH
jgi:hypothetical protein